MERIKSEARSTNLEGNSNSRNRQGHSQAASYRPHFRFWISRLFRISTFGFRISLLLLCSTAFAASVSSPSSIDGGGLHATSANYTTDNSVGGIGGISSAAADTAKDGYIGQLSEVIGIWDACVRE
jgi:hypothetical protein